MSTGARLMCAYTLLLAVAFSIAIPLQPVFASDALPMGVLLDNSATDEDWSIGLSNGGHYVNIFGGYESLGNPPVFSSERAWVSPGVVIWARVKLASSTTCSQLAHGGTGFTFYGPDFTAYGSMYVDKPNNGSYCDFNFAGDGVPVGARLSAAYLGSNNATLAGSSHNLGTSLNGSNEDAIDGGFAFQLCGMDGCSGGFTSTPLPEPPVATSTEATSTEPVATTTEPVVVPPTAPPEVPATIEPIQEPQHRPHSSSSVLPASPVASVAIPTVSNATLDAPISTPSPVTHTAARSVIPKSEIDPVELTPPTPTTPAQHIEEPSVPTEVPSMGVVSTARPLTASAYSAIGGTSFDTMLTSLRDLARSSTSASAVALLLIAVISILGFALFRSLFHLARSATSQTQ